MLKSLYIIIIIVLLFTFFWIYFTNLIWLSWQNMYLGSQSNAVSMWAGMFLLTFIWFLLGIFLTLFVLSLIKNKPKDFDEIDEFDL